MNKQKSPNLVNNTAHNIIEKIYTHSLVPNPTKS